MSGDGSARAEVLRTELSPEAGAFGPARAGSIGTSMGSVAQYCLDLLAESRIGSGRPRPGELIILMVRELRGARYHGTSDASDARLCTSAAPKALLVASISLAQSGSGLAAHLRKQRLARRPPSGTLMSTATPLSFASCGISAAP